MRVPDLWTTTRDHAARSGGEWYPVIPAGTLSRPPARSYGPVRADFHSRLDLEQPELGVLCAADACVVVPEGWVVASGRLLPEHSWYGIAHIDECRRPEEDVPVIEIDGTVLTLASDWADLNYGHFLLDSVPRLDLVERAGYRAAEMDHVICPHGNATYRCLLAALGIPLDRCLWHDRRVAYRCERLVAPSFPGTRRNTPPWSVDFLRRRLGPTPRVRGRRLYVPRTTTRRIANEHELRSIVAGAAFEVFDPASNGEDPRLAFAEASVVVGGHGAALADIAFCAPGTRVLDLLPSDMIMPGVYTEAHSAGLDYRYLVGRSTAERPAGSWGPSPYDFTVDPDIFSQAIADLCRR